MGATRECRFAPDWKQPDRGFADAGGNIVNPTIKKDYDAMYRRVYEAEFQRVYERELPEAQKVTQSEAAAHLHAKGRAATVADANARTLLDSFDWERHKHAVEHGESKGRIRVVDSSSTHPDEARRFHEDPDLACLTRTDPKREAYYARMGRNDLGAYAEIGQGDRKRDGERAREHLALPCFSAEHPHHGRGGPDNRDIMITHRPDESYRGRQLALADEIASGRWAITDRHENGEVTIGVQYWRGGGRQAAVVCGADAYRPEYTAEDRIKAWDRSIQAEVELNCPERQQELRREQELRERSESGSERSEWDKEASPKGDSPMRKRVRDRDDRER
jgi:hypothetical protein